MIVPLFVVYTVFAFLESLSMIDCGDRIISLSFGDIAANDESEGFSTNSDFKYFSGVSNKEELEAE